MADLQLTAAVREKISPKKLNEARRLGKVPAVMYGHKHKPQMLWVDGLQFDKLYAVAGESSIVTLSTGEQKKKSNVIIQDLAHDALTNRIAHIDFFEVSMDEELEAHVPLEFIGEAPAVREQGGVLVKTLEEVQVSCLPKDLPHSLVVDLSTLVDFSTHIQVANLILPSGVKMLTEGSTAVVLVEAPRTEAEVAALNEKVEVDVTKVEGVVKESDTTGGSASSGDGKENKK